MDTGSGESSSGNRLPERILCITHYSTGSWLFWSIHHFCLIITEKRVICVNTDQLLTVRHKEALDREIAASGRLLGSMRMALPFLPVDTEFSVHFQMMHPSDIAAAHPDAVTIPMRDITRFDVTEELNWWNGDTADSYWHIKITGRDRQIEFSTLKYPANIVENERLKIILGDRFLVPTKDKIGWLFGKKHD
jgi:hypothetical protein